MTRSRIAADANQELSASAAEMSKKAHDFDKLALPPERREDVANEAFGWVSRTSDPKEQKELAQVLASLDGDYGKGKCALARRCKCLDVTAVGKLMATSHDPEELSGRGWFGTRWRTDPATVRAHVELGNAGIARTGIRGRGSIVAFELRPCRRINWRRSGPALGAVEAAV